MLYKHLYGRSRIGLFLVLAVGVVVLVQFVDISSSTAMEEKVTEAQTGTPAKSKKTSSGMSLLVKLIIILVLVKKNYKFYYFFYWMLFYFIILFQSFLL